jgi:hypothetical protein
VHIQKSVRDSGVEALDDWGAKGEVVDEVAVHDVHVEPISTLGDNLAGFSGQGGEIAGKEGGSDNQREHNEMAHGQAEAG